MQKALLQESKYGKKSAEVHVSIHISKLYGKIAKRKTSIGRVDVGHQNNFYGIYINNKVGRRIEHGAILAHDEMKALVLWLTIVFEGTFRFRAVGQS